MNGRLSFTLRLCAVLIFMHASTRGCCRPEPMHHNESFVSLMMHKKREVVKGGAESENRPTEIKTKVPLLEMQALRMRVFSCSRIIPAEEAQTRRATFYRLTPTRTSQLEQGYVLLMVCVCVSEQSSAQSEQGFHCNRLNYGHTWRGDSLKSNTLFNWNTFSLFFFVALQSDSLIHLSDLSHIDWS